MRLKPDDHWRDDRVSLFLLTPDRVSDDYVGWLNDLEVNRFLESRFAPQNRASVAAFVDRMLESDRDLLLGIMDLGLGRHVGNIKVGPIDRQHGLGEIGIMIGDRAAWGRGIGSAAIQRVVAIAGIELGLRRLTAGCYAANLGSSKAFEKAGFRIEAVRPGHFLLDGLPEDAVLLGRSISNEGDRPDAHIQPVR